MASSVSSPGLDRLVKRLERLARITLDDARPLLEEFERIIVEDNRKGVLMGQDKDGRPMVPVRYRGMATPGRRVARRGPGFGRPSGSPKPGVGGNLTTAEYRRLTGPPLAPRGERSRVIANLETAHGQSGNAFFALGRWQDVVSARGVKFLPFHFEGTGHLPRRDLRGVRPWGVDQARKATLRWAKWLLKNRV